MKKFVLTAAFVVASAPAFAQGTSSEAMQIAVANNACGEGNDIVSARFLEDGRVGVRCASGAVAGATCIPFAAAAGDDELELRALRIAERQNACEDTDIITARFATENEVRVTCSSAAGAVVAQCPAGTVLASGNGGAVATAAAGAVVATNFVPVAAGLFAVVLGAAAAGPASSTSDTQ